METLERSRVCRLCGKHAGIAIDIFDKRGNHVKKINSVLPILVHEMDLLPKHICHPCNYKLQEFHKFYEECLKTDANLKGQLSWMRGSMERKETGVPMVQINNFMIKTEPPDYNDEETTEVIMHSGNLTNYVQNNCTSYSESIFTSSGAKCSRCGCYCGNRNRADLQLAKTDVKNRAVRHTNEIKNNGDFGSRDTIRRNLFATEIFGDKNPRIQTEVPVCNIPRAMMTDVAAADVLDADVRLHKLACRQNGDQFATRHKMADDVVKMADDTVKMADDTVKMADDTVKMATRTLRPRKKCVIHPSHAISAPDLTPKAKSKEPNELKQPTEPNVFKPVEIKVESCKEIRRSLRPRMETIDYSDSKRKNPMAQTTNTKRNKSAEILSNRKAQRKIDEHLTTYNKNEKFSSQTTVAIKIEPQVLMKTSSCPETEKNPETFKLEIPAKSVKSKAPKTIFEEFINKSITDKITPRRNVERPKSVSFSKRRVMNFPRRGHLLEYRDIPASPYLRSQRGHLRNGKLMEFNSDMEKPKTIRSIEASSDILLQSIKRENGKSPQNLFKRRDCPKCKNRFSCAELYIIHNCYTNKRH